MIENIRTHPYTRAVCLETARLFEGQAAKDLVEAQCSADEGSLDRARELQAKARLAQQRAGRKRIEGQGEMLLPIPGKKGEDGVAKSAERPNARQKKTG